MDNFIEQLSRLHTPQPNFEVFMMGDFYMTLPSNSSQYVYPDNNPGHFYTKLPQTYNLSGYEVGLAEIQFPNTYSNVKEDMWLAYKHDYDDALSSYILPAGLYDSPGTIIRELNLLLENKKHRNKTKFTYNQATRRTTLEVYSKEEIDLTPELASLLKLPGWWIAGPSKYISTGDIDVHANSQSMFVYCDLVTHRQVGDVMVPLLRTIPTTDKSGTIIYQIFEKPHYQRLSRGSFSTVEIHLSDDKGETPHFDGNVKTVVTLHLRPRRTTTR